jgi:hypothetical protein
MGEVFLMRPESCHVRHERLFRARCDLGFETHLQDGYLPMFLDVVLRI